LGCFKSDNLNNKYFNIDLNWDKSISKDHPACGLTEKIRKIILKNLKNGKIIARYNKSSK